MHVTLEGGTDAAAMVVFDPAALPDNFDAKMKDDPMAELDQLMAAGRLFWIDTAADGGYSLGVYSEELPEALRPLASAVRTTDTFPIPGGRLFFTGVEYAFRTDDALLQKYPHMGAAAEWSPGVYRAELKEFTHPVGLHERLLRERLPPFQYRVHRLMNRLAPLGCVAFLGLIAAAYWLWKSAAWAMIAAPILLFLVALPLILARLPIYRRADAVYKQIQREFPDFGLVLQSTGSGAAAPPFVA